MLLQLLISTIQTIQTTTQHPLISSWNQFLKSNEKSVKSEPDTAVLTTTAISTVTQLFSSVFDINFRNRRFPTTVFSSSVFEVTELKTITSTLQASSNRIKRNNEDTTEFNQVDSSLQDVPYINIQPTQPLPSNYDAQFQENSAREDRLKVIRNHPKFKEAWANLLQVFNTLYINN